MAWGEDYYGQTKVPVVGQSGITAIAAGEGHSVALRNDGSVIAWGANDGGWFGMDIGQTEVPAAARTRVTAIAGGGRHTVALKDDGTLLAWGASGLTGIGRVTLNGQVLEGVTAIAAGGHHTVALMSNGTVTVWGANHSHQMSVPPDLTGVTAIAAGGSHCLALVNGAPLLPYLDASRSGDRLILSWPTNATQFSLQWTPDLAPPPIWMNLNHTAAAVGSRCVVTNDVTGSPYYRLIQP